MRGRLLAPHSQWSSRRRRLQPSLKEMNTLGKETFGKVGYQTREPNLEEIESDSVSWARLAISDLDITSFFAFTCSLLSIPSPRELHLNPFPEDHYRKPTT